MYPAGELRCPTTALVLICAAVIKKKKKEFDGKNLGPVVQS